MQVYYTYIHLFWLKWLSADKLQPRTTDSPRFFPRSQPGLSLHPDGGIVPQRELADRAHDAQAALAEVMAGQALAGV